MKYMLIDTWENVLQPVEKHVALYIKLILCKIEPGIKYCLEIIHNLKEPNINSLDSTIQLNS